MDVCDGEGECVLELTKAFASFFESGMRRDGMDNVLISFVLDALHYIHVGVLDSLFFRARGVG